MIRDTERREKETARQTEGKAAKQEVPEVLSKTTYWIDPEDNPLIIPQGNSVMIQVNDITAGQGLEICVAPALLPVLRKAIDKAGRSPETRPAATAGPLCAAEALRTK